MYVTEDALQNAMNDDTMKASDTPHDTLHVRPTNAADEHAPDVAPVQGDGADEIFIDLRGNLTHTTESDE